MIAEIPEAAKAIPGLMTTDELALLCRMARSAGSIVELGTFKGRSLAAMMLTSSKARAWAVDSFGDMSHRGYQGSTEAETRANFQRLGLSPTIVNATTTEAADGFGETVDLLHVDAGHSYEECRDDLANWAPKVKPGGAICVHDYGKARKATLDRPEVQTAVDEWRSDSWAEVEQAGTMIAFRHIIADRGALYCAYGDKAREQAKTSIASLRAQMPTLPVAVVSDTPFPGADHSIVHVEVDRGARAQKTRMYSLSPFRRTLFLDADTQVLASPEPGFGLLDYGDVVLSQDPTRIFSQNHWPHLDPAEVAATRAELPTDELLYWNSGVIFFRRSERARSLFQAWHREWLRFQRHDQMALLRALAQNPVRVVAVRECWNTHHRPLAQFVWHNHRAARREGAPA
jgi:predicted O-methyltransferase YrrM